MIEFISYLEKLNDYLLARELNNLEPQKNWNDFASDLSSITTTNLVKTYYETNNCRLRGVYKEALDTIDIFEKRNSYIRNKTRLKFIENSIVQSRATQNYLDVKSKNLQELVI